MKTARSQEARKSGSPAFASIRRLPALLKSLVAFAVVTGRGLFGNAHHSQRSVTELRELENRWRRQFLQPLVRRAGQLEKIQKVRQAVADMRVGRFRFIR